MNSKRTCKSATCQCKTLQAATETAEGRPVWECGNCGARVARRVPAPKVSALDILFETLAGEAVAEIHHPLTSEIVTVGVSGEGAYRTVRFEGGSTATLPATFVRERIKRARDARGRQAAAAAREVHA